MAKSLHDWTIKLFIRERERKKERERKIYRKTKRDRERKKERKTVWSTMGRVKDTEGKRERER